MSDWLVCDPGDFTCCIVITNEILMNNDAYRQLTPLPLASFLSWLLESGLSPSVRVMPGTSSGLEVSSVSAGGGTPPSSDIMILFRLDPTVIVD